MLDLFTKYKPIISTAVKNYIVEQESRLGNTHYWGNDVLKRLEICTNLGKMVRGSLVLFASEIYTGEILPAAKDIAVALELAHTAILIHDDIIDRDTLRRGYPSMYAQYAALAVEKNLSEPEHFGTSEAICVADIGFFLAFERLSTLTIPAETKLSLLTYFAREYTHVGFGEMYDVSLASSTAIPKLQEIDQVYTYKTARYTFSLPFVLGALLTGQSATTIQQLETLGQSMGMLFQLRDDYLGIFGDSKRMGKPVGNDIREAKKTPYHLHLFQRVDAKEKEQIAKIFGNAQASEKDIAYVQTLLQSTGVVDEVGKRMQKFADEANECVNNLAIDQKHKTTYIALIEFLLTRTA